MINFSILITTYQRPDGSTPSVLSRALKSIINQSYPNWKIFLIGDKYENEDEFLDLISIVNKEKIEYVNLDYAYERDKYSHNKQILWTCGRVNARNVGLKIIRNQGYEYCCQLDHDDYWHPNHLESLLFAIENIPNSCMYHTLSYHFDGRILPPNPNNGVIETTQIGRGKLAHSSACLNLNHVTWDYTNVFESTGRDFPADAYMWEQIKVYCETTGNFCISINAVTCYHLEEGNSKK